jgi:hypothetical protein
MNDESEPVHSSFIILHSSFQSGFDRFLAGDRFIPHFQHALVAHEQGARRVTQGQ